MSDCEERDGAADEFHSYSDDRQEILPPDLEPPIESAWPKARLPAPIPIRPNRRAEPVDDFLYISAPAAGRPRLVLAAMIGAALALLGVAVLALWDRRAQADMIAPRADQTGTLARTIDALDVRLEALEHARPDDELAKLRRSVGEIRSNAASSRELSGAIARLAERVEKLDQDESAKIDRLGERVDRQASARTADLAGRADRLEKKAIAPAAPTPVAANPPVPPQKSFAPSPRLGPNVSMETTGSIARPRPVLEGYIVLGARDNVALVEGRYGERAVRRGDFLPGAGRVEGIARDGASWVVLTERGRIVAADQPD